jgi:hypothetical protein
MCNIITVLCFYSLYGSVIDEYRWHTVNNLNTPDSEFTFRAKNIGSNRKPGYTNLILSDSFYIAFHQKTRLHLYVTTEKKMSAFTVNINGFNCH